MKNKYIVYVLLTILLAITNLSVFGIIPQGIFSEVITLFSVVVIPGTFIVLSLKQPALTYGEKALYILGCGIAALYTIGIIANSLFPLAFIIPLRPYPLLFAFDTAVVFLFFLSYLRLRHSEMHISWPTVSLSGFLLSFSPPVFVVLSIFGAISLNNQGTNWITMSMLGGIALYIPLLILIAQKRGYERIYPFATFCISLAILLMLSLRSSHITGWDINDEFRVFQKTKDAGIWSITTINSAYNACLSITLLPTILSELTRIPDEFLFKIVYQIFFAFVPVGVYYFMKRFTSSAVSFLSVFYIILQPFFIQPTTALIRQETAFIFFVLSLLVIFSKNLSEKTRTLLFVIFGFGMILSHYSTSYVALALLTAAYLVNASLEKVSGFIYSVFGHKTEHKEPIGEKQRSIESVFLIILFLLTCLWYSQINPASGDVVTVIKSTAKNMTGIFTTEVKNQQESQPLTVFAQLGSNSSEKMVAVYNKDKIKQYQNTSLSMYSPKTYTSYIPHPIPVVSASGIMSTKYTIWIIHIFDLLKLFIKIAVLIGGIYLIIFGYKRHHINKEYIALALVGTSLIGLMLVHPTLGQFYNLSRIYLQILMPLSLVAVLGIQCMIQWLFRKKTDVITACILALSFLYLSGFVSSLVGGIAYMQLNNLGDDYDKFYTTSQEVAAVTWLDHHYQKNTPLFADVTANLRFKAYTKDLFATETVLPAVLPTDSYVYAGNTNLTRGRADANDNNGNAITYTFPLDFLAKQKNLIYTNGGSDIFQ